MIAHEVGHHVQNLLGISDKVQSARQRLGDVEEALNAASSIGDDRLQRQAGGHVVPESFTQGSSEQRMRWFQRGIRDGTLEACDTFEVAEL